MENYYYTQGGRGGSTISNSEGGRGETTQLCKHGHQKPRSMAGGEHHCPHCHGSRSSYNSGRQTQNSYYYPEDDGPSSSRYEDQYEREQEYYYTTIPADKLACVAWLADYLLFRLILMPVFPDHWMTGQVRTANAAYIFQSRVLSCVQGVELVTDRLGLMPRDSYSLGVWLEVKAEMKKMTESNTSGNPSLDPHVQQDLIQYAQLLLEELQQTDKKDETALYHTCYLLMRLILYASMSLRPTESDGTTFLRVVEELPQDRLTTFYKTKLDSVKILLLRALETPDNPGSAVVFIDHLGFLLYKLHDNIKFVDGSNTGSLSTGTKSTVTTGGKVRTTDVSRVKAQQPQGRFVAKPLLVAHPDGTTRMVYVIDPDNPIETYATTPKPQQSSSLSGAAAAAAVQSDKSSGIPSADELGMTEDEFAAHLQQQLMLEDMHAQKEMAYTSTGKSQSVYSTTSQSDMSSYYDDMQTAPRIVDVGQADTREKVAIEQSTERRKKKKPVKEPKMPKDLEMLESLAQMEEYVEERRQDYEEKQQNLDRILCDKQQLEMALSEAVIPVIKQALETELREKTQFLSLRYHETAVAKRKVEELDAYMQSKKRLSEPRRIEDLDVRATYKLLERNLERMQGNPARLHLMLERHLDILDTETLRELSEQLEVEAQSREDRIAEIKQRHEDAIEDAEEEPLY